MPKKRWYDGQSDWSGGANSVDDSRQIGPTQFVTGSNLLIDAQGGLFKRKGFQRIASSFPSGTCVGCTAWVRENGTTEFVACYASAGTTTVYQSPSTTIPMTLTNVGTFTAADSEITFARLTDGAGNPALYMADVNNEIFAVNEYYKWVPATSTVTTITPVVTIRPSMLLVHNQRLFAVAIGAAGGRADRLYWSGLNNGDTLGDTANGGGNARIETAGGAIVDMMSVGASLIILHSNGISRFTGWSSDDIAVSTQTVTSGSGIGFSKWRACISLGNVGYALADNGYVYRIDEAGNFEPVNLHHPLNVAIANPGYYIGVFNDRVRSTLTWVRGVGGNIGSSVPTAYNFNYHTGGWTTTNLSSGLGSSETLGGLSNGVRFLGEPLMYLHAASKIWQYGNQNKDDLLSDGTGGTAVTVLLQTRKFMSKSKILGIKALRFLYLEYRDAFPASPTVQVNASAALSQKAGASDTTIAYHVSDSGPSNGFQVTLTDANLDAIVTDNHISSIVLEGFEYGERF